MNGRRGGYLFSSRRALGAGARREYFQTESSLYELAIGRPKTSCLLRC